MDDFKDKLREGFKDKEYVTAPNGGNYRIAVKDGKIGCWRYWPHSRKADFIVGFNGFPFDNFEHVVTWAECDGRHYPGISGMPLSMRTQVA